MNSEVGTSLIKWPDHDAIQRTISFCLRVHYGLWVTAIIYCFELFIKKHLACLEKLAHGLIINIIIQSSIWLLTTQGWRNRPGRPGSCWTNNHYYIWYSSQPMSHTQVCCSHLTSKFIHPLSLTWECLTIYSWVIIIYLFVANTTIHSLEIYSWVRIVARSLDQALRQNNLSGYMSSLTL